MKIANDVTELIGNTPLVWLNGANNNGSAKVAKRKENADKLIVVVLPDTAERHISTALFG